MSQTKGMYSIVNPIPDPETGIVHAIDWDWEFKRQWARSTYEGMQWEATEGLDEQSHLLLLNHFGLEEWKDDFPIERVIMVSPSELAEWRWHKEDIHGLNAIRMVSDTVGSRVNAAMVK